MARIRRNPAPLSGAIFVRNGRKHRRGKRRNGLALRANGLALRANKRRRGKSRRRNSVTSSLRKLRTMVFGGKSRKRKSAGKRRVTRSRSRSRRRNGLALRANGLVLRANKRRWNRKGRRNGLALRANKRRWNRKGRRNGLALRTNKRTRRYGKGRRNGLALRANKRRWNRKGRRNGGLVYKANKRTRRYSRKGRYGKGRRNGLALRANKRSWSAKRRYSRNSPARARNGRFMSRRNKSVKSWLSMLPGGKMLLPALGGAGMLLPVHYALKRLGDRLPTQVRPVAYTASGLAVGIVAGLLGTYFKPLRTLKRHRKYIATTALIVGGAVDALRYMRGTSYDLGDGFAWEVVPYSGIDDGGLGAMYADASFADAYYTDSDLSGLEMGAVKGGGFAWRRAFGPAPTQMNRIVGGQGAETQPSRHAQEPGHRWGWLIALVGFENFQQIAKMPTAERQALIKSLREQAVATVQAQAAGQAALSQDATAGFGRAYGGMLYAGAAY